MTATVVAERPTPGSPRPYHFPPFERERLAKKFRAEGEEAAWQAAQDAHLFEGRLRLAQT